MKAMIASIWYKLESIGKRRNKYGLHSTMASKYMSSSKKLKLS